MPFQKKLSDIVYVVDNNLGTVGGEQESTKIIINGMLDEGVKVKVIQPGGVAEGIPSEIQANFVKKDRLKKVFRNPILFSFYFLKILAFIRGSEVDVIHTQAQVSFFLVSLARKLRLVPRSIVFVHTERGIYSKYSRFFRAIFVFFMRELDHLVCTTIVNRDMWCQAFDKYGLNVNVSIIENTAGTTFYSREPKNIGEDFTLGFSGRYCDWKDWPLAEEIVESINREFPRVKVKMAVGCLDQSSYESTKRMYERMKVLLSDRFEGIINAPFKEMSSFYEQVDFFVLTSKPGSESFGRTVVEAMSSGCIVFVTPGGGPPEVIGDNKFVYSSVGDLVDNISKLLSDERLSVDVSRRNIARAVEKYSHGSNILKHKKMYLSLCSNKEFS